MNYYIILKQILLSKLFRFLEGTLTSFTFTTLCLLLKNMGRSKHKIGFLEMQIHSLPRGGALRAAAEIKRFPW